MFEFFTLWYLHTSQFNVFFRIKLSTIKIANLQGEEVFPAVANANLVALCSLDQETNTFRCVGYGKFSVICYSGDSHLTSTSIYN